MQFAAITDYLHHQLTIYSTIIPIPMLFSYFYLSKARFHVTVITQINKFVVYFMERRNVKVGYSEC